MSSICSVRDFDNAIAVLDGHLKNLDYTRRSREGVSVCIRGTGCLADCVPDFLDREDLDTATEIFVGAARVGRLLQPRVKGADDGFWEPDDENFPDAPGREHHHPARLLGRHGTGRHLAPARRRWPGRAVCSRLGRLPPVERFARRQALAGIEPFVPGLDRHEWG